MMTGLSEITNVLPLMVSQDGVRHATHQPSMFPDGKIKLVVLHLPQRHGFEHGYQSGRHSRVLRYEDRLAGWIVHKFVWESMTGLEPLCEELLQGRLRTQIGP